LYIIAILYANIIDSTHFPFQIENGVRSSFIQEDGIEKTSYATEIIREKWLFNSKEL